MIISSVTVLSAIKNIAIIGGIMCICWPIMAVALTGEHDRPWLFIVGCALFYISVIADNQIDIQKNNVIKDYYFKCVKDNYTVFSDGEKVTYPDKVDLDKYSITIDDDDKEIVLKEK